MNQLIFGPAFGYCQGGQSLNVLTVAVYASHTLLTSRGKNVYGQLQYAW